MRYFKNNNQVFGYDELIDSQIPYIEQAIKNKWEEITGNWPPSETLEQTQNKLKGLLIQKVNDGANLWGYDSIISASTYSSSTNPQYALEAQALIKWRDDVWAWAISELSNVKAGDTADKFIQNMPKLPARPKA